MNQRSAHPTKEELPPIRRWRATFEDASQEKMYLESQWPSAVVKYKLLAIFGFLMSFGDPTVYTRGTIASFSEATFNALLLSLPFLFRNWSWFQKRHEWFAGFVLAVPVSLAMFITPQVIENSPILEPGMFAIIPFTLIIVTYSLFPVGMFMSTIMLAFVLGSHFIVGIIYLDQLTSKPYVESFLMPCTVFFLILWALMFFYHREMETGRRMRFAQLNSLEEKRVFIEDTFKTYMGGTVAETILTDSSSLGGEDRWVTILFTDLKGYSTIIEPMSPKEVLSMINEYFSEMAEIIDEYDGVVLEYIGDAMMIVFGAPEEVEHHQYKAVQCAMKMREHMVVLNERWKAEGLARYWINQDIPELTARAGIHTGHIVAGNIGSRKKMKYGAIGDVVNIAARLEQLNKQMRTDILFSRQVYVSLPLEVVPQAKDCGTVALKGREQEERVYSI
ncbi:MAG: adenylate/guanylate cyclase domain-containing protein [Myxococcota bacterium]|nr:adenylate/guanylate cyclase domain-containing protein [Myxococcota bacterium]